MPNESVIVVAVFDRRVFYEYMDTIGVGYVTGYDQERTRYDVKMVYDAYQPSGEYTNLHLIRVEKDKLVYLGRCPIEEIKTHAPRMLLEKIEKDMSNLRKLKGFSEACVREFQPEF